MSKFGRLSSWAKHLAKRRGSKIFSQTLRMFYLHSEPFHKLLARIFNTLQEYDAMFTFPLVAAVAHKHQDYVKYLKSYPYEIAIHGYKHVRYQHLSKQQVDRELQLATETFRKLKLTPKGFRAPYNNYSEETISLLDKYNFLWDIGIGYRPEYRDTYQFFQYTFDNNEQSSFTCIPLNKWSDDLMIDRYHLKANQISKILISELKKAKQKNGVIMFDLHPIRIGRKEFIASLAALLKYANKIDAWIPTVTEAVEYWNKHQQWKNGAPVCCLLTGDIDNFTFWDYLRRF
ncbi:MAG: polysaccharide deacetylase family protein [Asgard group archaeon]|nr:polysaccharide deacetylase family protein [Asgard group archaeon]